MKRMPFTNFGMGTLHKLRESTLGIAPGSIDPATGVIRGVKILGRESKNGRTYSDKAMQSACKLYEGADVCVDHLAPGEKRQRSVLESIGRLRNCRIESDAVYGDLQYLTTDPRTPQLVERAEKMPETFGLSHNVEGKLAKRNGKAVVEDVEYVHSVDIVLKPATNASLFESQEVRPMQIRELLESHGGDERAVALLADLAEMEAMPTVDVTSDMGADAQIHAAMKAMVMAVLDDDTMDDGDKASRIGKIVKSVGKIKSSSDTSTEYSEPGANPPIPPESVDINLLQRRLDTIELCEDCGVEYWRLTKAERTELLEADDTARPAMLEKFRKSQTPKPRVTGALRESRASGPISYEQAISEAKAARNRGPHFVIEE